MQQKTSLLDCATKSENLTNIQSEFVKDLFYDERFNSDEFKNKIEKAIENLAGLDPIISLDLSIYSKSLKHFEKIENYDSDKLYKKNLKTKYRLIKIFTEQIEFMIKKLLKKHGLIMRVKYYLYKKKQKTYKLPWDSLLEIDSISD